MPNIFIRDLKSKGAWVPGPQLLDKPLWADLILSKTSGQIHWWLSMAVWRWLHISRTEVAGSPALGSPGPSGSLATLCSWLWALLSGFTHALLTLSCPHWPIPRASEGRGPLYKGHCLLNWPSHLDLLSRFHPNVCPKSCSKQNQVPALSMPERIHPRVHSYSSAHSSGHGYLANHWGTQPIFCLIYKDVMSICHSFFSLDYFVFQVSQQS